MMQFLHYFEIIFFIFSSILLKNLIFNFPFSFNKSFSHHLKDKKTQQKISKN